MKNVQSTCSLVREKTPTVIVSRVDGAHTCPTCQGDYDILVVSAYLHWCPCGTIWLIHDDGTQEILKEVNYHAE